MRLIAGADDSNYDLEIHSDSLTAGLTGGKVDRLGIALDIEDATRELEEVRANNRLREDAIISRILMLSAKYRRDA